MSFSTIEFHPGPRIASVVLNRPPLNIINIEMLDELNTAWSEIEDMKVQVAVISGAGDRAFSAGVDVADHTPGKVEKMLEEFRRVILRIRRSDCVTIAAIHGHTLGGGAELAMMCDLIIAADNAQIGQPEISLGCYPPAAVAYLPGAIGFHKATEMVLLGEPVSAAEAAHLGIVNRVVPHASLRETVDGYVDKLLSKSSTVLALTKRALREGTGHHFETALDRAHELYVRELTKTEDMVEGIDAFLAKRPPSWRNR
jgi:cyclohexa-1,5-dienecarbonyl-CoA hydratase